MADKLGVGAIGKDVARLHARLKEHGIEVSPAEVSREFFGPGTREALLRFQQTFGLVAHGELDDSTTAVLTVRPASPAELRIAEGAAAAAPPSAAAHRLEATRPTNNPVLERAVEIARRQPPIVVDRPPVPDRADPGRDPVPGTPREQTVGGFVVLEHGVPAANVRLRVYQRGFGGAATLLTEARTNERGLYDAKYSVAKGPANIEVRAVAGDQEIPLSKPKFAAGEHVVLNLAAPAAVQPSGPEFARLSADVTREIGSFAQLASVRETEGRQDLTVLNRSTGWDARVLGLAAKAAALSADPGVGLGAEVLYGLFRAGLPSEKTLLARVNEEAVEHALVRTRESGIHQITDADIAQARQRFGAFARTTRLAMSPAGAASTYDDLLKTSPLKEQADRDKFATVFLKDRDIPSTIWDDARAEGLNEEQVQKLQVQGKLAYLTGNSHALTARLQQTLKIDEPATLADRDFFEADRWRAEIQAAANGGDVAALIPPSYGGDTVDARLNAYAEDMARKVRRSYPTQVVARVIERDDADAMKLGPARQATAALIKKSASQGFKLGATPVEAFLKQHTGVTAGMSAADLETAKQQVKTVQRVYQISSTDQEMAILMNAGLRSAYDVTAMSESRFIEYYGRHFKSPARARMVYHRATQVTSLTYNLFTIAQRLDSEQPVFGFSAPSEVKQAVREELIKHYPTLEALFGSMDYCECEHCRSVLSPAAYLVDLLQQFIDVEPDVWSGFLGSWNASHAQPYTAGYKDPYTALIARRPDLPYIKLTCENTHTAMPYIDVVNEILEYSMAHGNLAADAARDTGEATTAELLAEPQYITRQAYDNLREVHYPLNLPFDLWVETVRRFCEYFETPLWRVLETFRPGDALFAPTQRYDRSAIFYESLNLSRAELAIYTDPNPLAKWFELYGYATAAAATTIATDPGSKQRIDLNSAKALSRRLNVSYKELTQILQTGFVNPKLARLVVLYKLGTSIHSVKVARDPANATLYAQNKDLLDRERSSLSAADQARYDALTQANWETIQELQAFEKRIEEFTTRFNLTPAQIEAEMQAIPYDSILVLADPNAGCDFDLTMVQYASGRAADGIAFLKINLFVRLWRKLGWPIDELDRALQAFIPSNAPFEGPTLNKQPLRMALVYLAHLNELQGKVSVGKQARLKLLSLWSELPTTGKNPLYAQLFLSRSVLKTDDVFDHPLGHYLSASWVEAFAQSRWHAASRTNVPPGQKVDEAPFAANARIKVTYDALQETQHVSYQGLLTDADKASLAALSSSPAFAPLLDDVQTKGKEYQLVKGHLLALEGAFGLTAGDVRRILEDAQLSFDAAPLSLPNVSLLYRNALLARALKLSIDDLVTLRQLSGMNPFEPIKADPIATIADDSPFTHTMRFVDIARQLRDAGLKVEDLNYLLRHAFDATGRYRPDAAGMLALVTSLAEGIRAIRAEHAIPADPAAMEDDALRQKLGLVLTSEVVERLLAMLNGSAQFTATVTGVPSANQLKPQAFEGEAAISGLDYDAVTQEQALTFRGVLFDPEKTALLARLPKPEGATPHVPSATLGALLDDVQRQARAFFDKHLLKPAAGVQPASGFLDTADFALLFTPPSATDPDAAQQQHLRNQRKRLAEAFLPFLQERLVRQLIVQTIAAQTGGDPALVESLLVDTRLLGEPQSGGGTIPLLSVFAATGERGVQATFYGTADGTGAVLGSSTFGDADTELKDAAGNPRKPAGANSVRFEGYVQVPVAGAYRFFVSLAKQNAAVELRFDHLPGTVFWSGTAAADNAMLGDLPGQYLELKAGVPYRFTALVTTLDGGGARVLVQGETVPRDALAQLVLYPSSGVDRAERAVVLMKKALQIAQSLGLTERELRYVLTHAADFAGIDLTKLPTRAEETSAASATALLSQLLRLAAYSRLKRDLSDATDDLVGVLEANATADLEGVYAVIAKLMRRDALTVKATAKALWSAPTFTSEQPIERLWEALQIVERFGVPSGSLLDWTGIVSPGAAAERRFEIAREVKESIKARFDAESWQRVAQPIFDGLRARQRDALVSHTLHQKGLDRMEQLYEYFLIDPGMEPVVQTSRIRLAIASVQLFIQRCLLNLERDVHPSAIVNASYWEWMKRYRVWEANRKIFLFPENWLEPEFRDDKTHLFNDLESALLEGDVSRDLVEDAFLAYLRKLEVLARLDIVAMHVEDKPNPAERTLHVFGRTHKEPFEYFYRRYEHQAWTPWEPVTAEIQGDHLAPVMWRDRLYLFWVTFIEQPNPFPPAPTDPDPNKTVSELKLSQLTAAVSGLVATRTIEAHLHWSEYVKGEWNTKETGGPSAPLVKTINAPFNPSSVFVHVTKETPEEGEERGVFIHLGGSISASFYLAGRNSKPVGAAYANRPAMPFAGSATRPTEYVANGLFTVSFNERITTEPDKSLGKTTATIFQESRSHTVLPCNNDLTPLVVSAEANEGASNPAAVAAVVQSGLPEIAALIKPVFYKDAVNTLFVEPSVSERTIEEWQEWVTPTPQPEPGWKNPKWFEELEIAPEFAWKIPKPIPGGPWQIDVDSLIRIKQRDDWLVNPVTALSFDGELIGPTGRAPLTVLPSFELGSAILAGASPVAIHAGGDVGPANVAVSAGDPLGGGVLAHTGTALNVVGGAGFNAPLANNLGTTHMNLAAIAGRMNRGGFGG